MSSGSSGAGSGNSDTTEEEVLEEASLISHLVELRARLVKACIAILICFLCLIPFSEQIFTLVAQPLIDNCRMVRP